MDFTAEQKSYLETFLGEVFSKTPYVGVTGGGLLTASESGGGANLAVAAEETVHGVPVSELCKQERWKFEENPLDIWDKLVAHAETNAFPDEADNFRFRYHGLFHVAPAQNSLMLRLRLPGGEVTSEQLHGLAELAARYGNGTAQITTRANFQLREIQPKDCVKVLMKLQDLGLSGKGSGADNVRNLTCTPTSGFDRGELLDVRPFVRGLHHYILNHRDLFDLPRKFNISFESGGAIGTAADTNDIGFYACRLPKAVLADSGRELAAGVYFRVELGGISGHGDFAKDCGLLVSPSESVAVAAAMLRVFSDNADRTNRKRARLKYLLEKWGVDRFVTETGKKLAFPLERVAAEACEKRVPLLKHGWVGDFRQSQRKMSYLGVGIPVGQMSARQMHQIADLSRNFGKGEIRLTVWQNLLIPHLSDPLVETVKRHVRAMGFHTDASSLASGLVACTGNKGCKFSAADTKGDAMALGRALSGGPLDSGRPINIHFTGCPNSCAQHYCGDIGFIGSKLPGGREGYNVVLGGGMGDEQGIAREVFKGVDSTEVRLLVERILKTFERHRLGNETFVQWSRRHSLGQLQEFLSAA